MLCKVPKAASGLRPAAGTKHPMGPDHLLGGGGICSPEAIPAPKRGAASSESVTFMKKQHVLVTEKQLKIECIMTRIGAK